MEWISVHDRLPRMEDDVLMFCHTKYTEWEDGGKIAIECEDSYYDVGYRSKVDNPKKPEEWIDASYPVTHWMPLPEPPTTDQ